MPGAFTPGCSKTHLPGYVADHEKLKEAGEWGGWIDVCLGGWIEWVGGWVGALVGGFCGAV